MESVTKFVGLTFILVAYVIIIFLGILDVARASEVDYNDCLYQRMVTAAAYTALDDAEIHSLPNAVIQNLEIDLASAVEMEKLVCLGN